MLAGFEMASVDPRVVAINLVQSQDEFNALHDFDLQMHMLDYLHHMYPKVHISLHAGELTPGEVAPEEFLAQHIEESIDLGHAERIGHGLDIVYERNAPAVLAQMAREHILVEDCLYSHEVVRGMTGRNNVLPIYLRHHVPIALATDDEGVTRADLTASFERAVIDYHIDYPTLKIFVRDSLDHAFVGGASLWRARETFIPVAPCANNVARQEAQSTDCRSYLAANARAALEWREEAAFGHFESSL